jgi:hypothetical protein
MEVRFSLNMRAKPDVGDESILRRTLLNGLRPVTVLGWNAEAGFADATTQQRLNPRRAD